MAEPGQGETPISADAKDGVIQSISSVYTNYSDRILVQRLTSLSSWPQPRQSFFPTEAFARVQNQFPAFSLLVGNLSHALRQGAQLIDSEMEKSLPLADVAFGLYSLGGHASHEEFLKELTLARVWGEKGVRPSKFVLGNAVMAIGDQLALVAQELGYAGDLADPGEMGKFFDRITLDKVIAGVISGDVRVPQ